jgi:predicted XRE-type DNA-binding protein
MAMMTIEEAAEAVGVARQTIWRATKTGKLSSMLDENGVRVIDPSELFRVYEPAKAWRVQQAGVEANVVDEGDAATAATLRNADHAQLVAELKQWRERFDMTSAMHGERVSMLQARIEELMRDRDDFRTERDKLLTTLQEQAVTVRLLTAPAPAPVEQAAMQGTTAARRNGFFGWMRR